MDLRQIKTGPDDFGLMTYDPAFMNTANCRSAITYIDGDKGILLYRGYPIEQLAEESDYLETAYLILFGELPTGKQLQAWTHEITLHTMLHENIKKFMEGFRYDAHPMGIFLSTVGALSTLNPDAKNIFDRNSRLLQTRRLIAKVPSIAAYAFRHSIGRPYNYPDNELSFTGNFLNMLFKMTEVKFKPDPVLARALDVLFILHADHEQNCSTTTMRTIGSSQVDPYSALAGAAAALYGPLHGGANEAVLRMLNEIGSVGKVPEFIKRVKSGEGHQRLMGFGHRVYKSYDPRAKVIKKIADMVFAVTGTNPLLEIALELERIALQDEYFVNRKLYPNVDFYSGLIYQAMGFPVEMFPVLFAIPRTAGWIAQWEEMLLDPEQKIARPRQIYVGAEAARLRPAGQATVKLQIADFRLQNEGRTQSSQRSRSECSLRALRSLRSLSHRRRRGIRAGRRAGVRLGPRLGASPPGRGARSPARRLARPRADAQVHHRPAGGAGVAVTEQAWDAQTPLGTARMVNLIATIPGARADRIVISGHYDTKRFREFRFVGANDGGSSTAFLLEMARVLKARRNAADDRAAVPRRRRGGLPGLGRMRQAGRSRQHLRQPALRRRREAARHARAASRRTSWST